MRRGAGSLRVLLLASLACVLSFIGGFNLRGRTSCSTASSSKVPGSTCEQQQQQQQVYAATNALAALDTAAATNSVVALLPPSDGMPDACMTRVKSHYEAYYKDATEGAALRKRHGTLRVIAFSRLWVPPLHGTGGMQYHALHLYSQLAARGHLVHVLVTGPPSSSHRVLRYTVDPASLHPTLVKDGDAAAAANLIVHEVASERNSEYSESWFANCLEKYRQLNATVGGFHVAHSESWAGVPNAFQVGLQMAVTWHGSMFDWFRNEINLIVHNYRMKGKMTSLKTASRMKDLGASVAFEAYMLLTVPHHVVISDSAAKDLSEINLVEPSRVHLIYNGVNPQNFKPADSPDTRKRFLAEYGVPADHFVVGCGGRLEGIKGHHQLSVAMGRVLTKNTGVTLLVAGEGSEKPRYEAMKAKGLRVVLLSMLPQQKLAEFYQSLDLFVDPFYQHHGLNTVMLEAVLSAVPILATRLASAMTTAPCSDFGRTFGLGNINELVAGVEYFLHNPDERRRVGRNVRERAMKLFGSDIMAGSYERLLYTAYLNPRPLEPITGKVVCRAAYPAMCYREPA